MERITGIIMFTLGSGMPDGYEWFLLPLVFLLVLVAVVIWILITRTGRAADLARLRAEKEAAEKTNAELQEKLARSETESAAKQAEIADLTNRLTSLQQQRQADQRVFEEKEKALEDKRKLLAEKLKEMQQQLSETFDSLAGKALARSNERFLELAREVLAGEKKAAQGELEKRQQAIDALVKPMRELLEKQAKAITELEKKREGAYSRIEEQIKQVIESNQKLDRETDRLVSALRRPEQRGRWGEMQLRNVVELAGMTEHCDFNEQVQTDDPQSRLRPDMTINLPGGGVIVVDSKVALDAYLDALQPDADRQQALQRHARQVQKHYESLAAKEYWNQFDRCPKLVVMFMPLESALVAALEIKPELHAEAMRKNILIATPTLLVALLRAVAYGWQQEDVAENAREIAKVGRELYQRLAVFTGHLEKLGNSLNSSVASYNKAIGSLERSVLPGARRLKSLHATTDKEIAAPEPLESEVRPVVVEELRKHSLPES